MNRRVYFSSLLMVLSACSMGGNFNSFENGRNKDSSAQSSEETDGIHYGVSPEFRTSHEGFSAFTYALHADRRETVAIEHVDLDGDNIKDLVIAAFDDVNQTESTISIFYLDEKGNHKPSPGREVITLPWFQITDFVIGEFTGDSTLDLAAVGPGELRTYERISYNNWSIRDNTAVPSTVDPVIKASPGSPGTYYVVSGDYFVRSFRADNLLGISSVVPGTPSLVDIEIYDIDQDQAEELVVLGNRDLSGVHLESIFFVIDSSTGNQLIQAQSSSPGTDLELCDLNGDGNIEFRGEPSI